MAENEEGKNIDKKEVDKKLSKFDKDLEPKEPKSELKCSDGEVVSLKQAKHHFDKKIAKYPEKEQKILNVYYKKYRKYLGQLGRVRGGRINKQTKAFERKHGEVLELFGRMFSVPDVQKILEEEFGIHVSEGKLHRFKKAHAADIAKAQEKHKNSYNELRLSHKKSRLEELTEIYYKLKSDFMSNPTHMKLSSLKEVLIAVRNEVDGDIVINSSLNVELDEQIKDHFKREIFKNVNIKSLILSRVAARLDVSPRALVFDLNKSYYNEMNQSKVEDIDYEELKFPSDQTYDFDLIEEKHENIKNTRKKLEREKDGGKVNDKVSKEKVKDFKQKLLNEIDTGKKKVMDKKAIMAAIEKAKTKKE